MHGRLIWQRKRWKRVWMNRECLFGRGAHRGEGIGIGWIGRRRGYGYGCGWVDGVVDGTEAKWWEVCCGGGIIWRLVSRFEASCVVLFRFCFGLIFRVRLSAVESA